MKRIVGGAAFVILAWFFGGVVGAIIGLAVVVSRVRNPGSNTYWAAGAAAFVVAGVAVVVQGLPFGLAGPQFGARHWVATGLVGIGLACLAMAALIEIAEIRASTRPG
ncbi:MAG TPA: hypothetical protein VEN82_07320 [Actinomycetota bacterium]|nr:hypothetical protein [Actinomycetota bacterium]